jgi:hypothetical protein
MCALCRRAGAASQALRTDIRRTLWLLSETRVNRSSRAMASLSGSDTLRRPGSPSVLAGRRCLGERSIGRRRRMASLRQRATLCPDTLARSHSSAGRRPIGRALQRPCDDAVRLMWVCSGRSQWFSSGPATTYRVGPDRPGESHRQLARRERLRFHDGILPSQKRSQMIPGSKRGTDPGKTDLGERLAVNAERAQGRESASRTMEA